MAISLGGCGRRRSYHAGPDSVQGNASVSDALLIGPLLIGADVRFPLALGMRRMYGIPMVAKSTIDSFLGEKKLAIAGVSRSGRKFGNSVFKELKAKGYTVYPINPNADTIDGEICYHDIASLPEAVGGVVAVVPPASSLEVAKQAKAAGIGKLWLQKGAESPEVIAYCGDEGIEAVHGQCIMMFAEPVSSIHGFHRFLKKLFGGLPK